MPVIFFVEVYINMKIRKFRNEDATDVSGVMIEAFSSFLKERFNAADRKHLSPENFRKISNMSGKTSETISYVAEENGRIIGYIRGIVTINGLASLEVVGVSPDVFHKGVGTLLMEKLEGFCRMKNQRKICTCVSAHNKRALIYYIRNGFIPCGYRKDHFRPGVDEILLDKFLK